MLTFVPMSGTRLRQLLAVLLLGALSVAVLPRDWFHACVVEHDHHDVPAGADVVDAPCPVCDTLPPVFVAQATLGLAVHRIVLGDAVPSVTLLPLVLPLEAPGARGPPVG